MAEGIQPANLPRLSGGLLLILGVLGAFGIYSMITNWGAVEKLAVFLPALCGAGAFIYLLLYYIQTSKESKTSYTTRYEQLEKLALDQCPTSIKGYALRLSGDVDHSGVKLGIIKKFIRLKNDKYLNDDKLKLLGYKSGEKIDKVDNYWVYSKDGKSKIPNKIFINIIWYSAGSKFAESIPLISMLVKHKPVCFYDYEVLGGLVGDVKLKGISLVPVGKYNFVNSYEFDMKEAHKIVEDGVFLQLAQDTLENMDHLIDKAMGSDSLFQKYMQSKDVVVQGGGGSG